jgi:Dockerin type I domain
VWSILKGPGAISGSSTGTKVTVNGVAADSTTILQLLVTEGTCSTIVYDTLKNYKGVKGNVLTPNPFNQCSNPNFIVKASTPSAGTWKWEKVSGLGIITASDTSATIIGVQEGTTTLVRFIVTNGNCSDTVVVNLNNISAPLASVEKPLIEQCNNPNFTAKGIFSGMAMGTWSILKGPGAIAGSNTSTNVTVNGVLADSATILQLLVIDGQCSTIVYDTLKNYSKPPATLVTASPLRQCNNPTFSIAATPPSVGTGVWTRVSGVGTVGVGNPTTVTDVSAGFTTVVRWKVTNGVCADSVDLTLINSIQPKATLVTNSLITQCGVDSFTVQGGSIPSSFTSLGVWSKVKGPGTIGSGNPAKVTGVSGDSTTIVQWTIVNGVCVDSVRDTLKNAIFVTPQLITPANIEQCDNSTFNVTAQAPLAGAGSWSIESGLGIISGTGNAITVSGVTAGSTTVLNWKVVNDACKDSVKVTLVNRNPIRASLVTPPLIQKCNTPAFTVEGILPISGTGAWSIVSGPGTLGAGNPATITGVSADSTTVLKWKITSGACSDSILATLKNFKFVPAQISTANPLSQCDNPIFNIAAVNPSSGTGTWSILSGLGVLTGTNPAIVNSVTAGTSTIAQWKVVNGECRDSATITLRNDVKPADANAGIDKLNCASSTFTMTANTPSVPIIGTGTWTLQSGSSAIIITNPNSPITTVTGVPVGTSATLMWTIVNGSCSTSDLVQLTNSVLPVANAGADITQCPNTIFTLNGSAIPAGGTGIWSIIGASNNAIIANVNSPTTTVTGLNANSEVKIEWKLTSQNGCISRDTVVLKTFEALNPNAGADQIGCTGTFTLAATNPVGKWTIISSNSPLNFVDDTKPNTQVSNVSPGGTVVLKWTISNANCSASDTIQLYYDNAPPVPFIKKDTIYCNLDSFLLCSGRFKDTLKAVDTNNPNTLFFNWSLYKDPNSSLTPLLSGNTPFIDVTLDTGNYIIAWRVMDGCGNMTSFQYYKIRIKDCVPPAIDVYDKRVSLSGSIEFDLGGEAKICVSQILKAVGDNCTDINTLKRNLVLVRDDLNPTRKYSPDFTQCINVSCTDVNKTVPLQVWTVDKAGTPGLVISNIYVADNIGVCDNAPQPLTSIIISSKTENNVPIQNVKITGTAGNTTDELNFGNSATNGFLVADGLKVGSQYQFKAAKTDEIYMGVTTFDIALISRHILGLETINSPYALLAADVNEDGEIDATDIVQLRNFVLRRITDLPRRSWRFMDSSYVIQNRANPFLEDIPEVINVGNLTPNMQKAFKGIKKGDVSGLTPIKPNLLNLQERQSPILSIFTDDIFIEKGQEYAISLTAKGFNAASYQFTLGFTEGVARIQSIQTGNLPNMGDSNFGLFKNALTTSWNGVADAYNPQLFTLHFTAQKSGKLSEMLSINNTLTTVEAISKEGKPLSVELKFNHSGIQDVGYALYQNHPNPFDKETSITFNLPTETSAQLTVYSLDGRILYTQKDNFKAGKHEVKIDKKDIKASGVLYYRLDTPDFTTTRKMVLIK